MSEPPPLDDWYGRDSFARQGARGALLSGARQLRDGDYYVAYCSLRRAEAAVDAGEGRRIRGLVHLAVAAVKHQAGDARGAQRQLTRAHTRLSEGPPTLATVDTDLLTGAVEQLLATAPGGAEPTELPARES